MQDGSGMVDITGKSPAFRTATATGLIRLLPSTIKAISSGLVKKGDVISTARTAAILAVKDTSRLIPMCHQIPVTAVDILFDVQPETIIATVTIKSVGQTGVEMEALTGLSAALLNIWDMVKSLEKDPTGNYPTTRIDGIRVIEKRKEYIL